MLVPRFEPTAKTFPTRAEAPMPPWQRDSFLPRTEPRSARLGPERSWTGGPPSQPPVRSVHPAGMVSPTISELACRQGHTERII